MCSGKSEMLLTIFSMLYQIVDQIMFYIVFSFSEHIHIFILSSRDFPYRIKCPFFLVIFFFSCLTSLSILFHALSLLSSFSRHDLVLQP